MSLFRLPKDSAQLGLLAAFGAFLAWGVLPLFWKALASVDSREVLCQRMGWSFISLMPVMLCSGRLGGVLTLLRDKKIALGLALSSLLLAGNWFTYIWAVTHGMVLEASLGYYINPLFNVILGVAVFKEQAGRITWAAIALATIGVLFQVFNLGHLPVVSLLLGISFALYALLRKMLKVEALPGLFIETVMFLPFAGGYLLWQGLQGNSAFLYGGDLFINVLLAASGIITTIPLFWFAYGARRIRMTTLGLLQYLTPSMVFVLGVFVFREPLTAAGLATFGCIWVALALYTWDSIRSHRRH